MCQASKHVYRGYEVASKGRGLGISPWFGWRVVVCLSLLLAVCPGIALAVPAMNPESVDDPAARTCHSHVFDLLTPDELPSDGAIGVIPDDAGDMPLQAMPEGAPDTETYIPLVMITIGFEGQPYDDAHDWHDVIYNGSRSLSQYYKDMSCGKFTFEPVQETSAFGVDGNTNQADQVNDGVIHVTLEREKTKYWEALNNPSQNREMLECFAEALENAGSYIDFASYDSNGDGVIQTSELAVGFVVAGKDAAMEGEATGAQEQYMWPHAWSFSECENIGVPDAPVINGVVVDEYIAIAEYAKSKDGAGFTHDPIGTLAHELAHYLGLPDMYPTMHYYSVDPWAAYNVSYMSLLDNGCYGTDLEGNHVPFSLDMWSRVKLGWVDSVMIDDAGEPPFKIAGNLSSSTDPIAYRIDTANDGEYYLIENRRFTSWDEGMGSFYPSAAIEGEDHGGGLILWHVDDNVINEYLATNQVNDYDHHPGVVPLYFEKDAQGNACTIGRRVDKGRPFFDADSWGRDVMLPIYGTTDGDAPADRTLSADLILALESGSAPVMDFHLHVLFPAVSWENDHSSASLAGMCYVYFNETIEIETTTDITSEVVKRPSSTEAGQVAYTAHFKADGLEETTYAMIPPLDEEALNARDAAYAELVDLITSTNTTLAQGAYTPESFDALRDAIASANALFEDDTTVAEDIKAAETEILRNLRLLVPVNTAEQGSSAQDEEAAWRQAVYDLAELLTRIYGSSDAEAYKPAAYESFMEVVDRAYEVLADDAATTKALADAKTEVMRAETLLEKSGHRIQIKKAVVSGLSNATYDGTAYKPTPVVTLDGTKLVAGTDYTVSYAANTNAGTATVKVTGAGDYIGEAAGSFTITKADNPFSVKKKNATVKRAKVKKKAQKVKALTVTGEGTITYKKASGSKRLTVNAKTGKITVKKGTKKGTYKIKIEVVAAGNANYLASKAKTVSVKVKVK